MKILSMEHNRFIIVSMDSAANVNHRGGTEAIVRYLKYVKAAERVINIHDNIKGDDNLLAIGISIGNLISIFMRKRRKQKLYVLDVAGTQNIKRMARAFFTRFIESMA